MGPTRITALMRPANVFTALSLPTMADTDCSNARWNGPPVVFLEVLSWPGTPPGTVVVGAASVVGDAVLTWVGVGGVDWELEPPREGGCRHASGSLSGSHVFGPPPLEFAPLPAP